LGISVRHRLLHTCAIGDVKRLPVKPHNIPVSLLELAAKLYAKLAPASNDCNPFSHSFAAYRTLSKRSAYPGLTETMEVAILHLKQADPVLGAIIEAVGPYQLIYRKPTFETLVRSIVYQQVSGKAAASIFAKLKKAVGSRFAARRLLELTKEELRACGLSAQKAGYVHDLAEKVVRRKIQFGKLNNLTDDQVIEMLTTVKGVGIWTVQMFLMFALERPNILPIGDLGVRNAIRRAYNLPEMPTSADLLRISERWHPHCSVATWYLWRSLDGSADLR
jgi:DNA-3-methyladenine glycosylase II